MSDAEFPLVGECPICLGPSGADVDDNDAYITRSQDDDTDKYVELVWSEYYEQHVCRLCAQEGRDKMVDDVRNEDDLEKEQERQEMGFTNTYETNEED